MNKTSLKFLTKKEMSRIVGGEWIMIKGKWIWISGKEVKGNEREMADSPIELYGLLS